MWKPKWIEIKVPAWKEIQVNISLELHFYDHLFTNNLNSGPRLEEDLETGLGANEETSLEGNSSKFEDLNQRSCLFI